MPGFVTGIHAIVGGLAKAALTAEFRRPFDEPHAGAAGMHSLASAHREGYWTC